MHLPPWRRSLPRIKFILTHNIMETLTGIRELDLAITIVFILFLYFVSKKACKILDKMDKDWERKHNLDYSEDPEKET